MSQSAEASFTERAAEEIDALHRLLQAWFRAEGEKSPEPILARFDDAYRMVGASGAVTTYAQMVSGLPALWGTRPGLIMEIHDVVVRHVDGAAALVSYRETQMQDGGSNDRWSSALLIDRPDRPTPVWKHLQETFRG